MGKRIVISGGSLAGLFAGITFKRLGYDVLIFERSPASYMKSQGLGFILGKDIQAFIAKHDRTKTPMTVQSDMRHYLDRHGNEIDVEHRTQHMTAWDLLYNILRANFDGGQIPAFCDTPETLPGEGSAIYEYSSSVQDIFETTEGIEVHCLQESEGAASTSIKVVADRVIVAEGPSSHLRGLLEAPSDSVTTRDYVGYVIFRGTVPENELSDNAQTALSKKLTFYHRQGVQVMGYLIPGKHGTLEPGSRLMNWGWYWNFPEESDEFAELMTTKTGDRKKWTMLPDGLKDSVWHRQIARAEELLPPAFTELVKKTKAPYVQVITDSLVCKNSYLEGKVLLIGDSVSGFRPHTAAGTNQAALHSMITEKFVQGEVTLGDWKKQTLDYSREMQANGVRIGHRSQFGQHPLAA